jgi:probable blue pigment (indigoidine) exporter
MEAKLAWAAATAVAPVSWGVTYYLTRHVLPIDAPLWGSALRALPAGLVLLAVGRRRPRGAWWWRSAVLGVLNVGGFFVLVYLAAQQLPTSIAASIMALAPLALAGLGWLLLHEHPTAWMLTGAALGIGGVLLIVGAGPSAISVLGVVASLAALGISSLGAVLTKRWADETPVLASTSWQLLFGGAVLLVAAVATEGPPPRLDTPEIAGFGFVSLIATAVAFGCWFSGLSRLPAGMVGTIGLLNPVTGALVGTLAAGESLATPQIAGIGLVLLGILLGQAARPRRASRTSCSTNADTLPCAERNGVA